MNFTATVANGVWAALNAPRFLLFAEALKSPAVAQWRWLQRALARNATCAYGRKYRFAEIRNYSEFARQVPSVDYEDIECWINRIRCGEQALLTNEAVIALVPTSGSTSGRKLIPFTAGLQRDFSRAIDAWLFDTARRYPGTLLGPAYWSITPPVEVASDSTSSAVPIGFAEDSSYLGGGKAALVRWATVAPDGVRTFMDIEEFRFRTLAALLRERELRLISCWHPSFLRLLLDALPGFWDDLLRQLGATSPRRARELGRSGPSQTQALWPELRVISCWGDGPAGSAMMDLRQSFSHAAVEPKGLLATEACVTIPINGARVPAIRSHFFEFLDERGRVHLLHELRPGECYELIVTTSGGLWRYRLRDSVRVTGFVGAVPALEFVGRGGNVSDLAGEKLSEPFVAKAVEQTLADCRVKPKFALLAPDDVSGTPCYTLYIEGSVSEGLGRVLEDRLRENPHYACCRALGQLLAVSVFVMDQGGHETFVRHQIASGMRLGDIKPASLSRFTGWSGLFTGRYLGAENAKPCQASGNRSPIT